MSKLFRRAFLLLPVSLPSQLCDMDQGIPQEPVSWAHSTWGSCDMRVEGLRQYSTCFPQPASALADCKQKPDPSLASFASRPSMHMLISLAFVFWSSSFSFSCCSSSPLHPLTLLLYHFLWFSVRFSLLSSSVSMHCSIVVSNQLLLTSLSGLPRRRGQLSKAFSIRELNLVESQAILLRMQDWL